MVGWQVGCPVGAHGVADPGGSVEFQPENRAVIENLSGVVVVAATFSSPKWVRNSAGARSRIRKSAFFTRRTYYTLRRL